MHDVTTAYEYGDNGNGNNKTGLIYKVLYDANGCNAGLKLIENDVESIYYYQTNIQGDVIGILDENGVQVAAYSYDEWGKVLGVTGSDAEGIGQLNPIRYRGYYYDWETGFYYVSSRYYDPEVGRFISADGEISGVGGDIRGYNLYAYCFNNPVNLTDPNGNWPQFVKKAVKWVTKNIVQPVTKAVKKAFSRVNKTYSTGINVSGTPSASITVYQSRTNAPNINKLEKLGYQLGGSAGIPVCGVPLAGGADFNIIPDSVPGKHYYGTTTCLGVGIPGAELHAEWGYTATWDATQFNIFDSIDQFCINIMEW